MLRYTQLRSLEPWPEFRAPDRELELHLTGNMDRYTRGIDGVAFRESEPVVFNHGERLRLMLVTVDAPGNWPFHCHVLYHMEVGMFRMITVKPAMDHSHHEGHANGAGRAGVRCGRSRR